MFVKHKDFFKIALIFKHTEFLIKGLQKTTQKPYKTEGRAPELELQSYPPPIPPMAGNVWHEMCTHSMTYGPVGPLFYKFKRDVFVGCCRFLLFFGVF